VGIAPRKKHRDQAAKAALRLLCQDVSPYVGTLSTHLRAQASIEDSLARKPTRAEQDTDKPFAVLVHDWKDIRSYFFDSEAEAFQRFEQFKRIGRLALQLRGNGVELNIYQGNKQVKKDFDTWWKSHKRWPSAAVKSNDSYDTVRFLSQQMSSQPSSSVDLAGPPEKRARVDVVSPIVVQCPRCLRSTCDAEARFCSRCGNTLGVVQAPLDELKIEGFVHGPGGLKCTEDDWDGLRSSLQELLSAREVKDEASSSDGEMPPDFGSFSHSIHVVENYAQEIWCLQSSIGARFKKKGQKLRPSLTSCSGLW
jgi:hypothetical protein